MFGLLSFDSLFVLGFGLLVGCLWVLIVLYNSLLDCCCDSLLSCVCLIAC